MLLVRVSRNLSVSPPPETPFILHFVLEKLLFWVLNTEKLAAVLGKNSTHSPPH